MFDEGSVGVTSETPPDMEKLKGAYRTSWGNTWFSKVKHRGQVFYLGSFDTPEAAHEAYLHAKKSLKAR